jgi:hypothetical protein
VTVACADGTLYAFDDLCIREASGWIGMTAERRYNRHYALRLHGPQRAELTMIIRWCMGVELGRSWETERSQVKGDKTVDQDQKRERYQSNITGTCTGVADGVFMTDLG